MKTLIIKSYIQTSVIIFTTYLVILFILGMIYR